MLVSGKKSIVLGQAIKNIENAEEVIELIEESGRKMYDSVHLIARFKNKRVIECISVPQIIDGKVVGRIWSNRDITERVNSEREEIEKGVAQAQFESLKNQVNPHFLFNSLNVLSSLVHIDPDLSEKFIDQLARSYRYLLEQKDKELVPLKTEIEFVNSFSFLLKIRFEEKLKINIKLPAEAMNDLIAPLTLQLLIENAVKHNTISIEEPLIIDLFMDSDNYLVVKNNLQARVQRMPSTGVGLKNIINRYKLLTTAIPEFQILNDRYIARIPLIKTS
jgi:LytS/YehU family sensor histidine kinase